MRLFSLVKKKNFTLLTLFILIILINFFVISNTHWKENLAQNIRIYTCQPNFTRIDDTQKFKIKRLIKGVINFFKKGCNYEKLNININFNNFDIIKKNRIDAIQNGVLIYPDEVPATIYFKNKKYRSNVRLKGDLPNHWSLNKQWSFKIELKGGKSINGMNEFSITKLIERRFPDNLIIANQFERLGVISPKFKIYKTTVNGQYWGLMIAEEQFSKVFLERRKLKEGLIFKLTNETDFKLNKYLSKKKIRPQKILLSKQGKLEVDLFNTKKINKLKHLKDQESIVKSINSILNSNYDIDQKYDLVKKHFDIKKIANFFANSLAFNSLHSLYLNNVRFYLNPYDLIIEPIPTDNFYNKIINLDEYKYEIDNINLFYKFLYKDENFINEYNNSLKKIKNDIANIKKDALILCEKFEDYCQKIVDFDNFEKNISNLINIGEKIFLNNNLYSSKIENKNLSKITNNEEELSALNIFNNFIYARLFYNYIKFYNLTLSDINIDQIILYVNNSNEKDNCKILIKKNCKIIKNNLKINLKKNIKYISYNKFKLNLNRNEQLIWAEIYGNTKNNNFKYSVRFENKKFDENNLLESKNLSGKFLNNLNDKTYILNGKLLIDEPILIPKNFNLKILPGSELNFTKNSYIYLNGGNLIIDGKEKEVLINSEDEFWGGIYVYNSKKKSKIINASINSTKNFEHEGIFLTGGINFYKSNVDIINSTISGSKTEDALNVINSKFLLKNSFIKNALSDGIDSDFSKGIIVNTIFKNIGGDAIDTSGSKVEIIDTEISKVKDKAISAGENSNIDIKNLKIYSSKFGIVSKDLSNVNGEKIFIKNSDEYDVMAFEKKMHYGPGFIDLKDVKFENKVISQKKSVVKINNIKIENKDFNPKIIY